MGRTKKKKAENCIGKVVQLTAPDLQIKRFYTDGAYIEYVCPKCDYRHQEALGGDRINYPVFGKPYKRGEVWCDQCQHEWNSGITLTFSLSVIGAVRKKKDDSRK